VLVPAVEHDPTAARFREQLRLVGRLRKGEREKEAGGAARHVQLGETTLERADERLAPAPVHGSDLAQVPVEVAAREELRECDLREARRRDRGGEQLLDNRCDEPRGEDRPADAHGRREHRTRGSDVRDVLRRQSLQRCRRLSVGPEVCVEVVLDHELPAGVGPLEQRAPPIGRECGAARELMVGTDDDGRHIADVLDADAAAADADRHDLEP
jgi:hypothetical protein